MDESSSFSVTKNYYSKTYSFLHTNMSVLAGFIKLRVKYWPRKNALCHHFINTHPLCPATNVCVVVQNNDNLNRSEHEDKKKIKNTTKCHGCPTSAASNRLLCRSPTLEANQPNQSPSLAEEDITAYKVSGKVTNRNHRHWFSRWLDLFLDSNLSRLWYGSPSCWCVSFHSS